MNIEILKQLDDLLETAVQKKIFGCAITIGNGTERFYTSEHGDIHEDTYCMLCSMTKPITVIGIWILIERGKIDIYDPI